MHSEGFLKLANKFKTKLDNNLEEKTLMNFANIVRDLYIKDYNLFLGRYGLDIELNKISKAQDMMKKVDSFGINYKDKTIEVNLNDDKIKENLIDMSEYYNKLGIPKNSWEYYLVASIFSDPDVYESFQITNTIIL